MNNDTTNGGDISWRTNTSSLAKTDNSCHRHFKKRIYDAGRKGRPLFFIHGRGGRSHGTASHSIPANWGRLPSCLPASCLSCYVHACGIAWTSFSTWESLQGQIPTCRCHTNHSMVRVTRGRWGVGDNRDSPTCGSAHRPSAACCNIPCSPCNHSSGVAVAHHNTFAALPVVPACPRLTCTRHHSLASIT